MVLLSMAVVLTIILSILSRTVTDVAVTSRGEEALRAFSAAEAGVEQAIVAGSSIGQTQIGDASFSATVSDYSAVDIGFNYPVPVAAGESAIFWFVSHDKTTGDFVCDAQNRCFTGNSFIICWGNPGTAANGSTTPAIEISTFYAATPGDYSTIRVARATADPNSVRRASNNFAAPADGTCTIAGERYQFTAGVGLRTLGVPAGSYNSPNGLLYAKVRFFYNTDVSHKVGIVVAHAEERLPAQGLKIESTGVSGEANRKIEVFRGFGEQPPIFDSAVFSPGGLTK